MRLRLVTMSALIGLSACAPAAPMPVAPVLLVFSQEESKFLELDAELEVADEIPFAVPEGCALSSVFGAPRGPKVAIELACPFGPAVVVLDTATTRFEQPITDSDSHFLAWAPAGDALYLKVNSVSLPRIVRWHLDGRLEDLRIPEFSYDLAPAPGGESFLYSTSPGMGLGSETYLSDGRGNADRLIAKDDLNYLALARWSPDGRRIAFIKIPDSSTPFTVGELWVMGVDGSGAHRLAEADAGHGTPPAWSPDGEQIAFAVRENPEDASADVSAEALISNLYLADVESGQVTRLTGFEYARVQDFAWMPGGERIAFTAVLDDRMTAFVQDIASHEMKQVTTSGVCCATWLQR